MQNVIFTMFQRWNKHQNMSFRNQERVEVSLILIKHCGDNNRRFESHASHIHGRKKWDFWPFSSASTFTNHDILKRRSFAQNCWKAFSIVIDFHKKGYVEVFHCREAGKITALMMDLDVGVVSEVGFYCRIESIIEMENFNILRTSLRLPHRPTSDCYSKYQIWRLSHNYFRWKRSRRKNCY